MYSTSTLDCKMKGRKSLERGNENQEDLTSLFVYTTYDTEQPL